MNESSIFERRSAPASSQEQLRFLCRLGQGGMAEVHLAARSMLHGVQELVVVKRMHAQHQEDPATVRMFLDEAGLALRLDHPNIVRTERLGRFDGRHGIVMEFLEGQPLQQVLKRAYELEHTLSLESVAMIGVAALSGLAYAHELAEPSGAPLEVVHRDVSPQNLFLTYDGQVKLLDFGIAKTAVQEGRTRTGLLKGKVSYMAPEQARGEPLDRRADLWSLGVLLWEAASGSRLFRGSNEAATLNLTLTGEVRPPSERRPDIPPELDAILMRALERDRERRYASAAEMRDALTAWLERGLSGDHETTLAILMRRLFSMELVVQREKVHALLGDPGEVSAESGVTLVAPALSLSSGAESGVHPTRISSSNSVTEVTALIQELTRQRRTTTRLLVLLIAIGCAAALTALYLSARGDLSASEPQARVGTSAVMSPMPGLPPATLAAAPVVAALAQAAPTTEAASLATTGAPQVAAAAAPRPPRNTAGRLPRARAKAAEAPGELEQEAVETGLLNLDSNPWSVVTLAGRVLGQTPLVGAALPPGTHSLVLTNPELGLKTTYQVTISAGRTTSRRVGLD